MGGYFAALDFPTCDHNVIKFNSEAGERDCIATGSNPNLQVGKSLNVGIAKRAIY
jgi:hypothetical protein